MRRVLAGLLLVVVLLTGCMSGDAPAEATITVTITGDLISPNGAQVEVRKGATVTIAVTSDRHEVIHVHGYDAEVEVGPGTPATTSFTADKAGSFEIETHENPVLVAQLVVKA